MARPPKSGEQPQESSENRRELTPQEFIHNWAGRALTERAAAQAHFIDLCRVLGVPTPTDNRVNDSSYGFEARTDLSASGVYATRTEDGLPYYRVETGTGSGFADVWKRDHFAWEYKRAGRHSTLDGALAQLRIYAPSLGNPPLLIVSDIDRYEIHTNFTGYPPTTYAFGLTELVNPSDAWRRANPSVSPLEVLRKVFDDPKWFRPARTREAITAEYAKDIGSLAQALRDGGNDPHAVAHFIMQIVFCFFAEDIGLLPRNIFTDLIQKSLDDAASFPGKARSLFKAMELGGHFGADTIEWFNGGLYQNVEADPVITIAPAWLGKLLVIARKDWNAVDPTIFGTLFERSLDPGKRSQIGAHYTSREDILLIVEPVVMQPLRRRWVQVQKDVAEWLAQRQEEGAGPSPSKQKQRNLSKKIEKAITDFANHLGSLIILDPACGSGNFLFVTIQQLLDLENEVRAFAARPQIAVTFTPRIQPRQLRGIDVNDYACELARVSIWIGYLQWLHANGSSKRTPPILDPLDTIEHRDAILKWAIPSVLSRDLRAYIRDRRGKAKTAKNLLRALLDSHVRLHAKFIIPYRAGPYVLDHFCYEAKLAVELGPPRHETDEDRRREAERSAYLRERGIRLLRFTPQEVLHETELVVDAVMRHIPPPAKRRKAGETPHPPPLESRRLLPVSVWRPGAVCLGPAHWPPADFIIGNPPFLGSKLFRKWGLPDDYVEAMYEHYDLPNTSDLCCYWFERARMTLTPSVGAGRRGSRRVGLLATQGIRGRENRTVLQRIKRDGDIFMAWSDRKWILDGAMVHVSMIGFDDGSETTRQLNGTLAEIINANLTQGLDLGRVGVLMENDNICFQGQVIVGDFEIERLEAARMFAAPNPSGESSIEVIAPVVNAKDIMNRDLGWFIVDFGQRSLEEASLFEKPFQRIETLVKPVRIENKDRQRREKWWWHGRPGTEIRAALLHISRQLATPRVAKHRVFRWYPTRTRVTDAVVVVARDDDYFFGVLHSSIHELWARCMGTQLREVESGFRYTPTTCFETFALPWPPGSEPVKDPRYIAIAEAARELNELRESWLNPPEWIAAVEKQVDVNEDFSDVPDDDARKLLRHSAIMAYAAKDKKLKQRTLTNLYNERPSWLKLAHRKLDEAVIAAYAHIDPAGDWDVKWAQAYEPFGAGEIAIVRKGRNPDGPETAAAKQAAIDRRKQVDEAILANLLRLNQQRAVGA